MEYHQTDLHHPSTGARGFDHEYDRDNAPQLRTTVDHQAGDVQTKPAYHSVKTLDSSFGFGMRPFNASIAQQLAPVTDLLFAKLGNLLTDSTRAVDLTPTVGPAKSCVQGIATRRGQTCERVVFVPGGIDLMAVQLESDDDLPEADVYLTQNQQGYVFKFEGVGSEWRSDSTSTCRVYGGQAGFRLCLKNSAEDLIYASKYLITSSVLTNVLYPFKPPNLT